jgi:MFS family permease
MLERRVLAKRDGVDRYLAAAYRHRGRLVQVTIIAGSVAAALTAAPALGGKPLADWLTAAFGLSTPAWRILCLAAMMCSLAATIATQVHKSNNYEEHIARAQSVRAALEALDFRIVSGHLSQREATNQYLKCIQDASFIDAWEHSHARSPLHNAVHLGGLSSF